MNTTNLMQDRFYAGLMWHIESKILDTDKTAHQNGIVLTDSNVKSALAKAKALAKKGRLKAKPKNTREELVFELAVKLDGLRKHLREGHNEHQEFETAPEIKLADWVLGLKAVEDSLALRMVSGGRAYLDYVKAFIEQGKENLGNGNDVILIEEET